MPANGRWELPRRLTLNLLRWKTWCVTNNELKCLMGINSAFNT